MNYLNFKIISHYLQLKNNIKTTINRHPSFPKKSIKTAIIIFGQVKISHYYSKRKQSLGEFKLFIKT